MKDVRTSVIDSVRVFAVMALAFLSPLLVIQIGVIQRMAWLEHAYGEIVTAIPLAIGLALVSFYGLPFVICTFRKIDVTTVRRRVAFCLYPLHLSWLSPVGSAFPVFGDVGDLTPWLVAIGVGAAAVAAACGASSARDGVQAVGSLLRANERARRWSRIAAWVAVPAACVLLCGSYWSDYLGRVAFDDGCDFGGDQWEYESIAVNLVKGHGFPRFGGIEPFSAYKFRRAVTNEMTTAPGEYYGVKGEVRVSTFDWFRTVGQHGGENDFYRTPGYPLFLGLIYKLNGVSPLIVKRVQLFLLVVVGAFLPLVGFLFWRWHGFLAGAIAGRLFLNTYHRLAADILTESLMTFAVFVVLLAFACWERRKSTWTGIGIGLAMGLALLVKGLFVLLPVLLAVQLVRRVHRGELGWQRAAVPFVVLALVIGPWSLFATFKNGSPILLSTQGQSVLRGGNNERAMVSGLWDSSGITAPGSFYQREDIKALPASRQVLLFYITHLDSVPLMVWQKIRAGFDAFLFLRLALLFVGFEMFKNLAFHLLKRAKGEPDGVLWVAGVGLWLAGFAVAVQFVVGASLVIVLRAFVGCVLLLLIPLVFFSARTGEMANMTLPPIFVMFFLNSLIITMLLFGEVRFMWPLEFVNMLVAIRYGLFYLGKAFAFGWRLAEPHATG